MEPVSRAATYVQAAGVWIIGGGIHGLAPVVPIGMGIRVRKA